MNYIISDFVIRIKNAKLARRRTILVPYANILLAISIILVKNHFLKSAKEEIKDEKKFLSIELAYDRMDPIVTDVEIISKPSLRVYVKKDVIPNSQRKGLGISILSTSKGICTASQARKLGLGGELLFRIW